MASKFGPSEVLDQPRRGSKFGPSEVLDAPPKEGGRIGKSLEGATITAEKQPVGVLEKAERWAQNVQNDIRHGTDLTGVGTVLKFLGAHGVDYGAPEKVGEYMASMPLGAAKVLEGGAQIGQGQVRKGGGNVVSGALQAAEIPSAFVGGPELAEGVGQAGVATKAVAKVAKTAQTTGEKMRELIPSAERAGKNFTAVMNEAKDIPIDVSAPGDVALKIQQLSESGASRPKVIGDFLKRVTDPDKGPLTYEEARNFYSNASRLSTGENMRLTPIMKRQVAQFTADLNKAIEQAAGQVGKTEQYQKAMAEYHKAMQIRAVADLVKNAAKNKAVQTAVGTGAGYAVAREVLK